MRYLILFLILLSSCASLVSKSKNIPSYITQEADRFYINLIFDHIPNYTFLLDEVEISADFIQYQKIKLGHLIKVPVNEGQKDFKVKSALQTYLHKQIHLKENPQKLMLFASFSSPVIDSVAQENPDLLIVFSPPATQYYTDKDFLRNPIFHLDDLRLISIIGVEQFRSQLRFKDFAITNLANASYVDRPTFLTHYLPFTYPQNEDDFVTVARDLKRKEIPVVFLSSFPRNLIQQIPKGQMGLPTYEFSVKNHFLALPEEDPSPWEMITDLKSDYMILTIDFINSYWHILLEAKDETQGLVFSRDLTLYQTKPLEGRNRRNAR